MPLKVFISYRRLDTQWPAKTLYDALGLVLPAENIFYDIDSIPPGEDFEQFYKKTAGSCDVLLALIGPQWINAIDDKTGKRRLDDPTDPVRNEIGAALKQKNTTVVPVLFDGTAMPPAARLPPDLQRLPTCNAEFVNTKNFEEAVSRLLRKLGLPAGRIGRHGRALPEFENWVATSAYQTIALMAFVLGFVASVANSAGLYGLTFGGDIPLVRFNDIVYALSFSLLIASMTRTWSPLQLLGLFLGVYVLQDIRSVVLMESGGMASLGLAIIFGGLTCGVLLVLQWLYSTLFFSSRNQFFRRVWVLALVAATGVLQELVVLYAVYIAQFDVAFNFSQGVTFATTALLITYGLRKDQQYTIPRPV